MLMISRRAGERIVIGGEIEIVVAEIRRRSVRLGVAGGANNLVLRGEVHDAIEKANRCAAATGVDDVALRLILGEDASPQVVEDVENGTALAADRPASEAP